MPGLKTPPNASAKPKPLKPPKKRPRPPIGPTDLTTPPAQGPPRPDPPDEPPAD